MPSRHTCQPTQSNVQPSYGLRLNANKIASAVSDGSDASFHLHRHARAHVRARTGISGNPVRCVRAVVEGAQTRSHRTHDANGLLDADGGQSGRG
jgi:hypothetical protein